MGEKLQGKINIGNILRVVLIILLVLFIGFGIFYFFTIRTKADHAFRDAKNVYLALSTAEIEYYSRGESIYDPTKYNGLSDGVMERVRQLVDNEGSYRVISYNTKEHRVTGMIYYNQNFYVTFDDQNGNTTWEVKYLMPIFTYKD
ncbi:MAG: hypothetical protein J5515_00045 [Lachnospiraceae bacterium]|nr:hypothetical protein [Lachnospiraceae bacterium]